MRISDWSSDVCSSDLFAQVAVAALLALSCRANVPVAALTTFITNPLTTPIVWVIAYKVGNWLLHIDAMTYGQPLNSQVRGGDPGTWLQRSEEHTSELQSLMRISYAVFCLKKTRNTILIIILSHHMHYNNV